MNHSLTKNCFHISGLANHQTADLPSGTIGHDLESLQLSEPVATAPGHIPTTAAYTAAPIATNSDTQRTERRLRDISPEEICLLEKPLKLRFFNVPTVRRQLLSPQRKQEKSSRAALQHSNGDSTDGISIGPSSFDDECDHDDDDDDGSTVDSSNNNSNDDEATSQDIDGYGSNSPEEEEEPLAKKLLERKENKPLATRILERTENTLPAKRVLTRKNLGHDNNIASPAPPSLIRPASHSAGSGSGSESKSASRPTTTKVGDAHRRATSVERHCVGALIIYCLIIKTLKSAVFCRRGLLQLLLYLESHHHRAQAIIQQPVLPPSFHHRPQGRVLK